MEHRGDVPIKHDDAKLKKLVRLGVPVREKSVVCYAGLFPAF